MVKASAVVGKEYCIGWQNPSHILGMAKPSGGLFQSHGMENGGYKLLHWILPPKWVQLYLQCILMLGPIYLNNFC